MKLVRASRPTADVEQKNEAVQAVRIFAFVTQDAVEDDLRGDEVRLGFAGVVSVRARAGREIDEREASGGTPRDNLRVVLLERREKEARRFAR